jgi:septal ring-binding cell division protein DamX
VALVGAAAFVAYGMWKGSSGPGSSSSGLEPIPEAEKIDYVKLAEGLTVPASTPPPEKKEPAVVPAPRPATPKKPAATAKPAAPAAPAVPAAGGSTYEMGLSHFKDGSYENASATWKTMLREQGSVHTVQIVVACQIDTVKNAFSRFGSRKIFTVPLTLSGRTCYRVCYGIFPSKEAAAAAIDALPVGLQKDLSVKTAKSII